MLEAFKIQAITNPHKEMVTILLFAAVGVTKLNRILKMSCEKIKSKSIFH